MRRILLVTFALAPALLAAACGGDDDEPEATATGAAATQPAGTTAPPQPPGGTGPVALNVQKMPGSYARPTFVTNAGDGSGRLFVLEKPGRIRIIRDGAAVSAPFLDISSLVRSTGNEQGLLGLAFHPDFERNGRFFVAYTALDAANTVAEYRVTGTAGSDRADGTSGRVLLAVPDQYANHNGGMLAFGPDGYLYISMGDGGSGGDPDGNGQKLNSLLGKLLRIDVDGGEPYAIPADNPFRADGQRREIWAYGLRNPWRFSFDREAGDAWIADVGQNKYEEIDFQPANSKGGENYGWNTMEGSQCYKPATGCDQSGMVKPVFEYDHGDGCSVTGGYVYRGTAIPALAGRYVFTDYCSATLWITTRGPDGAFSTVESGALPDGVSAFGEDEAGELYITVDGEGAVYRLVAR